MDQTSDTPPARDRPKADAPVRSLRWAAAAGALAVAGLVALSAGPADAQSVDQLNSKIDAARADAEDLAAEIEANGERLDAARADAVTSATREAQLTATLAAGEEREAQLARDVQRSQERLAAARARLARAQDALSARLVAIFKGESIDETTLLLDAEGYDDLTTRALLLRRIQQADQELATRVRSLRNAVAERLAAAEEAREAQAAHNREVAAARDEIAAARAAAEARAAALAAARSQQAAAIGDLRSNVDDWTAQVQQAQQASVAESQATVAEWVGAWAIPEAIVMCESGGNFGALNPGSGAGGAYQILPSTWRLYGGSGLPHQASPAEQHRIAAMIWADSGGSAWVCAG